MIQYINKQSEVTEFVHMNLTLNTHFLIFQIAIRTFYLIFSN